ncbi:MAG: siderophore ABC transporter substrate-binding protein [Vibrio hibernica]
MKNNFYQKIGITLTLLTISLSVLSQEIKLTHIMGNMEIKEQPERVVILGLGPLDAADALHVNPIAISKMVIFPHYLAQYDSSQYPSVGTIFEPDFEAIYNQKPDLIIIGPRSTKHYNELKKIAPTYVFSVPNDVEYWEGTQKIWRDLGRIFNKEDLVDKKIKAYSQRFLAITRNNQRHNMDAMMIMSSGENISSFGQNSRFAVIYQDLGFIPTLKNSLHKPKQIGGHGNLVSYELITQVNPSTLLIMDRDKIVNSGTSTTHQKIENNLIKSTKAYKNQRVVYLNITAWYVASSGITATDIMLQDIEALSTSHREKTSEN